MQQHRADVRLEVHARQVEGEGPDTLGGRGTDSRQRAERDGIAGKLTAMFAHHDLGSRFECQCAAVITHTLPRGQHIGRIGSSQSLDTREALDPLLPTRQDTGHLGLLKHDLRQPDRIGIARTAPRKVAIQAGPLRLDRGTERFHIEHDALLHSTGRSAPRDRHIDEQPSPQGT